MSDERLKRIEETMDRFDGKLDKVVESVGEINVTLVKQSAILEEHTRRSLANEKAVDILASEMKPIILHVAMVKWVLKVVGAIAVPAIAAYLIKVMIR